MTLHKPEPLPTLHPQAAALMRALVGQTLQFFEMQENQLLLSVRTNLLDIADQRLPLAKAQNVRSAIQLLGQQGPAFRAAWRRALPVSIADEIGQCFPELDSQTAARPLPALDGSSLSLIDVGEVHRLLLLDRICQRFNMRYDAGLEPLTLRLGLLRGIENATLSENPLRPLVFARAFLKAWESGPFDAAATEDLIDSLHPDHFVDLTPLYTDLNCTLASAGIAAQKVHRVRKSSYTTAAAAAVSVNLPPPSAPPSQLPDPSLPASSQSPWSTLLPSGRAMAAQARDFLLRLGVKSGAGAGASVAAPPQVTSDPSADMQVDIPLADERLLRYLDDLQSSASRSGRPPLLPEAQASAQNVLHLLRGLEEVRQAPEPDRATIDVLAEVFDYVFSDTAIPLQIKVILGQLQIPVLKAAMMDRDFFMSPEHPARKLVDTLAHASVGWNPALGEQDPLYQRIEHTVQRVLHEFVDDLGLFSELLADFTEFLFETEQQAQARNEPVAQHETRAEDLQTALAQADELVHARLQALNPETPLARFLTPFLTHQWREVLARAWLDESTQQGHFARALATMDQLIWSIQPKTSSPQRQELVAVLPGLVHSLNAELDTIHWGGEPRINFTKRLIATHMVAIRMKATPAPDHHTANQDLERSEQALLALEQRRAAQRAARDDAHDLAARTLQRGQWFEVRQGGAPSFRSKLQWISPMRTRFLFTNREGFDAFVRSEREVAGMLRMGQLVLLDQSPIVARALDQLLAGSETEAS